MNISDLSSQQYNCYTPKLFKILVKNYHTRCRNESRTRHRSHNCIWFCTEYRNIPVDTFVRILIKLTKIRIRLEKPLSGKSGRTDASAVHRITRCAIFESTLAFLVAICSKIVLGTPRIAARTGVTGLTSTESIQRMASENNKLNC